MSFLDHALRYAERGWRVIPLREKEKSPWVSRWTEVATTDPDQLREWWGQRPDSNVGIATGAGSGLVVLDLDGPEGEESLGRVEQDHGPLPATLEARTGSGGRHLFFRHPGVTIPNGVSVNGYAGLDVRGDGGQVVAPPSIHPSGTAYEWLSEHEPAPLPDWLRFWLLGVDPIPEGQRDDTITKEAGRLWNLGLDEDALLEKLRELNEARCHPPLEDEDLQRIARSARKTFDRLQRLDDIGQAERLVDQHGDRLRYVAPWRTWLVWDGGRWARDETGEVMRRAKQTARNLYLEAYQARSDQQRKAILSWARRAASSTRLKAAIELARSDLRVAVVPGQLDADPWLLNAANGTVDLRTGELRPHRPEDLMTKLAPVAYDPEAEAPRFEAFLSDIMDGNQALVDYLQRAVGYSLTGEVVEQVLFFLYGTGANGKSTFLELMLDALGDYAKAVDPELLLWRRGEAHPTGIADLVGVRFGVTTEVEDGRRLAEIRVKQLTGGDRIKARFLYQDFFEFDPTHKLWVAANQKPEVRGTDFGIWRRLMVVPFEVTFPATEQDRELGTKLREELSGVLAWAIRGCLDWQEQGIDAPEEVKVATGEYRREEDWLGRFLEDCCTEDCAPNAWVRAADLYRVYQRWAKDSGEYQHSKTKFGKELAARGFDKGRDPDNLVTYLGLQLREEVVRAWTEEDDDAPF